jgi:hypothetical protein
LKNEYIDEIVITDETGDDIDKIIKTFGNQTKLKLFKNETRLGPFLNKMKACSYSKNEWIALIDSDNFADENYFKISKTYLEENLLLTQKNIILSPSRANPNFDFSHLSGFVYSKGNFEKNLELEKANSNIIPKNASNVLMNTGNYVINKFLIDNINLTNESDNIKYSSACDVIYFNTLLFEQSELDLNLHVVPNLEYEHVIHAGSIYTTTEKIFAFFNESVYQRYNNLT